MNRPPEPGKHAAVGPGVVVSDLASRLAVEGAHRWLTAWNDRLTTLKGWERLDLVNISVQAPFQDYGMPIALVRGQDTGTELVLFFRLSGVTASPTIQCLDPATIGFDTTGFKPPTGVLVPAQCELHWHKSVGGHPTEHFCHEPDGHDQSDTPTPHICPCGATLPLTDQPV